MKSRFAQACRLRPNRTRALAPFLWQEAPFPFSSLQWGVYSRPPIAHGKNFVLSLASHNWSERKRWWSNFKDRERRNLIFVYVYDKRKPGRAGPLPIRSDSPKQEKSFEEAGTLNPQRGYKFPPLSVSSQSLPHHRHKDDGCSDCPSSKAEGTIARTHAEFSQTIWRAGSPNCLEARSKKSISEKWGQFSYPLTLSFYRHSFRKSDWSTKPEHPVRSSRTSG